MTHDILPNTPISTISEQHITLEPYLLDQVAVHPSTQPRDIIKQCYQAAYGAEHLLKDTERAYQYLEQEYTLVTSSDTAPLWEAISPQVCRVNLAAWKHCGLPLEWLFRMFAESASISVDREQATRQFLSYLDTADTLIHAGRLTVSFSAKEWDDTLTAYKKSGMPAVHHSEAYRRAEQPAYRILRYEFVRLLPAPAIDSSHCGHSFS